MNRVGPDPCPRVAEPAGAMGSMQRGELEVVSEGRRCCGEKWEGRGVVGAGSKSSSVHSEPGKATQIFDVCSIT